MTADMNEPPDASSDARTVVEAAGRVSDSAGFLVEELKALRTQLAVTEQRRRRGAFALVVVSMGFALDIALTVTMTLVVIGLVHTNHSVQQSLAQNYVTASQQAQTRVRVLCPLYEVLLAASAVPPPPSQATAASRDQYAKAVKTIRDGYTTLGCQPPLPPSSH